MQENWKLVLKSLQEDFPKDYDLWFIQLEYDKFSKKNNSLILNVSNKTVLKIIEERFKSLLEKYCGKYVENPLTIVLKLSDSPNIFGTDTSINKKSPKKKLIKSEKSDKITHYISAINEFNKKFTFERFVSGDHSDLAFKASQLIANQKDGDFSRFNPFFIYGGVGLGKTHLVQSIGNYITKHSPNFTIRYVTAEKYLNDYIEANITKTFQKFRDYYRNTNILILDDVQFLENKEKIQDEIFNNFNKLYQNNQQIILTCDKHPKNLKNVQERLISRFSWGLTVDIKPPDIATRKSIIIKKLTENNITTLDENIIDFLAKNITQNIRDIESAVTKINSLITLMNKEITIDLLKTEIENILTPIKIRGMNITVFKIQKKVSEYFNISIADLKSKRSHNITLQRHLAIYICKEVLNISLSNIGEEFGNRDHSTVLASIKKIEKDLKTTSSLRNDYEEILRSLTKD